MMTVLMEQAMGHNPVYHPPYISAHISLLWTVCDWEISVKFTRNFPKMLKHTEIEIYMQLEYQLLAEDSKGKSPSCSSTSAPGMPGGAYH